MWCLHVFHVSAWVLSRLSGLLPESKNMQAWSVENVTFSPGVSVAVMNCRLVQGAPCLRPMAAEIRSPTDTCEPKTSRKQMLNVWMDGCCRYSNKVNEN